MGPPAVTLALSRRCCPYTRTGPVGADGRRAEVSLQKPPWQKHMLCLPWGRGQCHGTPVSCTLVSTTPRHQGRTVPHERPPGRWPSVLAAPQSQPSPLGAQGQVELADGLQELPLQHLVGHPSGQGELELVVGDALGLPGPDRAVEVTQPLDGMQLAWAGTHRRSPSRPHCGLQGSRPRRACPPPAASRGRRTRDTVLRQVTG